MLPDPIRVRRHTPTHSRGLPTLVRALTHNHPQQQPIIVQAPPGGRRPEVYHLLLLGFVIFLALTSCQDGQDELATFQLNLCNHIQSKSGKIFFNTPSYRLVAARLFRFVAVIL